MCTTIAIHEGDFCHFEALFYLWLLPLHNSFVAANHSKFINKSSSISARINIKIQSGLRLLKVKGYNSAVVDCFFSIFFLDA